MQAVELNGPLQWELRGQEFKDKGRYDQKDMREKPHHLEALSYEDPNLFKDSLG